MTIDPCRFCRGEGALDRDGPHGQGHDSDWRVKCNACGATGPKFAEGWEGSVDEVKAKAIEAWNARPPT